MFMLLSILALSYLCLRIGIVGETLGGDQTTPATGRQGKTGESIVQQLNGKYFELASRCRIAFAADQAGGIAATATAISTVALVSLYNPINSGRRLSLLKVWCGYFSGTFVAGSVYHCVTPQVSGTAQTTPSGGTSLTSYWSDVNYLQVSAAPVGLARTASTVVAPIVVGPFCSLGAFAGGANNSIATCSEDMDGAIVLEPGGSYQLQCLLGTGTSPKLTAGLMWAEVPMVATQG